MIVLVLTAALLALSIPLVAQLRTLDADRERGSPTVATRFGPTATRVLYSILVVVAYAVLPLAWAVGAVPTAALAAFVTAPLAMRLGDVVSHRSGEALRGAQRDSLILLAVFVGIVGLALSLFAS